jgi:glycosyltransferase involved in cell wall biosynthesis
VRGGLPLKVAFQIDQLSFPAPGGIGTYVWELGSELLRSEVDAAAEVVPFRVRSLGPPPRMWLLPTGIPILVPGSVRALYPAWNLLARPALPDGLRGCDVVHATNHAAVPPVGPNQGLVVTVHDLAFDRYPHLFPAPWRWLYRTGVRAAARRAHAILTPSRATADDLCVRTDVEPARVHVTPLASSLPSSVVDPGPILDELGVPRPYLLCPATLEPRKNQVALVRAYRQVATEVPHALVLAGPTGWRVQELEAELARRCPGRVVRTGPLEDERLDAVYRGADLVVYPSRYEGFGLPVVEAMARGVPVVASTTPAVAETAGDAALLVDPEDVGGLADAIAMVLTDGALADDLRRRGRERAATFSWVETARATLRAYREIVERS